MAVNQNFELYSGDTADVSFVLTDAQGLPLILNGLTLWWGMGDILKTSPDDITALDNTVTVHLAPADSVELTTGGMRHQLRAVDVNGRVETFATGICRVTQSVFQPTTGIVVVPGVRTLRLVGGVRG